jgi:hypothetical protein
MEIGRDDRPLRVSCDFPAPLFVLRGKRCFLFARNLFSEGKPDA